MDKIYERNETVPCRNTNLSRSFEILWSLEAIVAINIFGVGVYSLFLYHVTTRDTRNRHSLESDVRSTCNRFLVPFHRIQGATRAFRAYTCIHMNVQLEKRVHDDTKVCQPSLSPAVHFRGKHVLQERSQFDDDRCFQRIDRTERVSREKERGRGKREKNHSSEFTFLRMLLDNS